MPQAAPVLVEFGSHPACLVSAIVVVFGYIRFITLRLAADDPRVPLMGNHILLISLREPASPICYRADDRACVPIDCDIDRGAAQSLGRRLLRIMGHADLPQVLARCLSVAFLDALPS